MGPLTLELPNRAAIQNESFIGLFEKISLFKFQIIETNFSLITNNFSLTNYTEIKIGIPPKKRKKNYLKFRSNV